MWIGVGIRKGEGKGVPGWAVYLGVGRRSQERYWKKEDDDEKLLEKRWGQHEREGIEVVEVYWGCDFCHLLRGNHPHPH